ncbi:hypothetical protein QAD02_000718 [Eretmocerus hayati]|uniref:Uncharacterized protein n=1 Tax=Eretmocerus hayati TaxID=131215 RepID=A0ACC2NE02_9HYME|nr:hypothetical protein QAD02_000718 [Eretmocerus hayati]
MGKSKSKPGKSAVPAKKQKIDDSESERYSSGDGLLLDAQTTGRETPPSVQDDNSSSAESDSDETESSEEALTPVQKGTDKGNIPEENVEAPLDEEMAKIFGKDPTESEAANITFHSCVIRRWKH